MHKNIFHTLKQTFLIMIIFVILSHTLFSKTVSITQLGFIIKRSIPSTKTIAVLYPSHLKNSVIKDAKMAYTILRKKIVIFDISIKFDLTKKINRILSYKDIAVIIITDNSIFSQKTIKFISRKLLKKGIPLFTNRQNDTKFEALACMFYNDAKKLEKHISKQQLQKLNLEFSDETISKFIIDL